MPKGQSPLIQLKNISHVYKTKERTSTILENVNVSIHEGTTQAFLGTSGSGKSTVLNILGFLENPSIGEYMYKGNDVTRASSKDRAKIRNLEIGFIFQSFNLLPRLSAIDNVALPLFYRGVPRGLSRKYALDQIMKVGLEDKALHIPAELSGGQRQRIAIARALVGSPSLILADEPTGNLDTQSANDIIELLIELNHVRNVTLVIVTHDQRVANRLERRYEVKNKNVIEIK